MRREGSRLRDQHGLTLVEVLAALAVIGIGVVGVVVVVPVAIHGVHEGYQVSTATFLAEQALERARAVAWSEGPAIDCLGLSAGDTAPVPTGAGCYGSASTQFPDEPAGVADHPHYRRAIRVTRCASEPCTGAPTSALRRVEVVVGYTPLTASGVSAIEKTIRLESLVTPR
jgi:prepilin-type N-terminal cleavage/methylation domain-containing protein